LRTRKPQNKCACESGRTAETMPNLSQIAVDETWSKVIKKPVHFLAKKIGKHFIIKTLSGTLFGRKGDWILVDHFGNKSIMREEKFDNECALL